MGRPYRHPDRPVTETPFLIRPFEDGDVDDVAAVWKSCELSRPWNDPVHDMEFCQGHDNARLFVGLEGGRIVATVMTGHDGHRGAIYYLGVHPDHRGKGYGKRMTMQAEIWLRDLGVWKLNLMIRDDNLNVRKFYESIGYEMELRTVMARRLDGDD
ncbi:MAG: GNAT family acetyltransferase [Rhodospirillaceae bacterium]|nr:GNAT family acetyltransferase [Rhodospirillaceae bacterium]